MVQPPVGHPAAPSYQRYDRAANSGRGGWTFVPYNEAHPVLKGGEIHIRTLGEEGECELEVKQRIDGRISTPQKTFRSLLKEEHD
ncbi:uncharacterized protein PHACADRAFT_258078 [Phanerochaete carnosa HHB-10118-sp]|uniref:Uncharacterized protein n=1 Tax=Phanerochaete carnosa (strain HHB-10118-sp) TaxID=650164 RepID=K5UWB0_PHACS|nr:uncharacterized protein PHACADRAFT_258078 [Phanerochaete carnosa HHB-10118-sp]EKM54301.1 hypothetical protein PHACADRAFT_258078 [Phanerochaete carnosa HHB-10118-sp]